MTKNSAGDNVTDVKEQIRRENTKGSVAVSGIFRKRYVVSILIISGYIFLTLLFTRPLFQIANTGYIADLEANGDGSYHFNPFHLSRCLDEGSSCTHTDLQFYPIGNNLQLNTNTPIPSILSQFWNDTTAGLNYIILFNFFITALGGYLFARLWIKSRGFAFIAGALFAFWMGKTAHMWYGHANLLMTGTLPFALYALHRFFPSFPEWKFEKPVRWKWLAGFLGLFLVTIFHDLIVGGYLIIYSFLMLLVLVYWNKIRPLKWYWQVLILGGYAGIVDQLVQWLKRGDIPDNAGLYYSGTIANYFVPHDISALYSELHFWKDLSMQIDAGRVMFWGYSLLLGLAIVFTVRLARDRHLKGKGLALILLGGTLYTMPLLRWIGTRFLYGPFAWTHFIPLWNENRCPTRFSDITILLAAILVFSNIEKLKEWKGVRPVYQAAFIAFFGIILFAEHFPSPFKAVDLENPPVVYRELAEKPDGAVLFVPFSIADGKQGAGTYRLEPFAYQPVYGKPMVNGYLSRMDEDTWEFFENDRFISRLIAHQEAFFEPEGLQVIPSPLDSVRMSQELQKLGFNYVVLREEVRQTNIERYIEQSLEPFIRADSEYPGGYRMIEVGMARGLEEE